MTSDIELNSDSPPTASTPSGEHLGDTVPLVKKNRATRPLKVFLVEDDAFIRERVIEKIAAGRSKVVDYADSAAEAIVKLRDASFDVIILDLELKQGTGFQVLREVRTNSNSRPWIIVFTHFADA